MKVRLTLSILVAAAISAPAMAADLAARPITKAPPMVAPIYNWGGFYIGGHLGYGWSRTSTDQFNAAGVFQASGDATRGGVIGGGQIGYNFMLSPNWVLGIEADISGADLNGSAGGCSPTGCSTTNSSLDYFGTVRGRLGYAVDNVLFYGTGGLLWAHTKADRTIDSVADPRAAALAGQVAHWSSNPTGWVAGGGIEWGFAPNWSTKVEYLYGEFDTTANFNYVFINTNGDRRFESHHELQIVRIGVNYRFGGPIVAKY